MKIGFEIHMSSPCQKCKTEKKTIEHRATFIGVQEFPKVKLNLFNCVTCGTTRSQLAQPEAAVKNVG